MHTSYSLVSDDTWAELPKDIREYRQDIINELYSGLIPNNIGDEFYLPSIDKKGQSKWVVQDVNHDFCLKFIELLAEIS